MLKGSGTNRTHRFSPYHGNVAVIVKTNCKELNQLLGKSSIGRTNNRAVTARPIRINLITKDIAFVAETVIYRYKNNVDG